MGYPIDSDFFVVKADRIFFLGTASFPLIIERKQVGQLEDEFSHVVPQLPSCCSQRNLILFLASFSARRRVFTCCTSASILLLTAQSHTIFGKFRVLFSSQIFDSLRPFHK